MRDLIYPNITAPDTVGQIQQIVSYLFQLKEQLEFILSNIGEENLSLELRKELNSLGAEIQLTQTDFNNNTQRMESVANKQLTVSDVINSSQYQASVQGIKDSVAIGGDGYVKLIDGTLMCYGNSNADVMVFSAEFSEPPVIITSPYMAVTATTTGFSLLEENTEGITYSWLAIGRYTKEKGDNE